MASIHKQKMNIRESETLNQASYFIFNPDFRKLRIKKVNQLDGFPVKTVHQDLKDKGQTFEAIFKTELCRLREEVTLKMVDIEGLNSKILCYFNEFDKILRVEGAVYLVLRQAFFTNSNNVEYLEFLLSSERDYLISLINPNYKNVVTENDEKTSNLLLLVELLLVTSWEIICESIRNRSEKEISSKQLDLLLSKILY